MSVQIRTKKSTVSNQLSTAQAVQAALPEPTEALEGPALQYFRAIMESREAGSWSNHDRGVATMCAMAMSEHSEAMAVVRVEGRVADNGKPHVELVNANALAGVVRQLSSQLGLSASQRGLTGSVQAGRNQADRQAREVIADAAGTLLA